jgi:voltage-gated potassium channel
VSYFDPERANDPASSPRDGGLASLVPLALGLLDGDGYAWLKDQLRTWATRDPIDALVAVVFGGGIAFYLAERDTNPACQSPWDGVLYMSTSLSVGYDNLFPTTSAGHALATFAQAFGPALAAQALAPPAAPADDVNRQILARLEDIVRLLEAR